EEQQDLRPLLLDPQAPIIIGQRREGGQRAAVPILSGAVDPDQEPVLIRGDIAWAGKRPGGAAQKRGDQVKRQREQPIPRLAKRTAGAGGREARPRAGPRSSCRSLGSPRRAAT